MSLPRLYIVGFEFPPYEGLAFYTLTAETLEDAHKQVEELVAAQNPEDRPVVRFVKEREPHGWQKL